MTTTFGTAPKANDGIASPRADTPNKPPKLRREIEVMETSPIDLSSTILSDGVAKENKEHFTMQITYIEKNI
jgi:hypothetical protein